MIFIHLTTDDKWCASKMKNLISVLWLAQVAPGESEVKNGNEIRNINQFHGKLKKILVNSINQVVI